MGIVKPEFHEKGWGSELWIVNDKYCLKEMNIYNGKRCSIHYHKIKDETFVVKSGKLRLLLFPNIGILSFEYLSKIIEPNELEKQLLKNAEEYNLGPGDYKRILPMTLHQFYGNSEEPAVFYEFSTTHFEEDSYRLVKGD